MHFPKLLSLPLLLLGLSACSVLPDPIDVQENVPLVEFESVEQAVAAQGQYARWGGSIVEVVNKQDYSEIELVQFPTNSYGKPKSDGESKGRFKARVNGFVDPLVFEQGRLVTLVGQIVAPEAGMIGEQSYNYPVLAADGYHMWKLTQDVEVESFYFSPFPHYWGASSFYYPHGYFRSGFYNERYKVRLKRAQSKRVDSPSIPSAPINGASNNQSRPLAPASSGSGGRGNAPRQQESTAPTHKK